MSDLINAHDIALHIYDDEEYVKNPENVEALIKNLIQRQKKEKEDSKESEDTQPKNSHNVELIKKQVFLEIDFIRKLEKEFPVGIFCHKSAAILEVKRRKNMIDNNLYFSLLEVSNKRRKKNTKILAFPTSDKANFFGHRELIYKIHSLIEDILHLVYVRPLEIKLQKKQKLFPNYVEDILSLTSHPETNQLLSNKKIKDNIKNFLMEKIKKRDFDYIQKLHNYLKNKNKRKAIIAFLEK